MSTTPEAIHTFLATRDKTHKAAYHARDALASLETIRNRNRVSPSCIDITFMGTAGHSIIAALNFEGLTKLARDEVNRLAAECAALDSKHAKLLQAMERIEL